MRRREFLGVLGGAATGWPHIARAQQLRRIGVLMNTAATNATGVTNVRAFVEALARLGWIEAQNIRVDVRWNAADAELARVYAAQLIGLQPDVILCSSTPAMSVEEAKPSLVERTLLPLDSAIQKISTSWKIWR
jgi:putative tryptophan/tyrosine transport system substrate-binding protein